MDFKHIDLKVFVIGDMYVGKTSLIRKKIYNVFATDYMPTHGVNINTKTKIVDDTSVDAQHGTLSGLYHCHDLPRAHKDYTCPFSVVIS